MWYADTNHVVLAEPPVVTSLWMVPVSLISGSIVVEMMTGKTGFRNPFSVVDNDDVVSKSKQLLLLRPAQEG